MTSSTMPGVGQHPIEHPVARASAPDEGSDETGLDADNRTPPLTRHDHPRWQRRYQRALVVTDFVMALFGGLIASVARWKSGAPDNFGYSDPAGEFALALLWVGVLFARGAYERSALGFGLDGFRHVLTSGVYLLSIMAVLAYATETNLSRGFVFGSILLIVTMTMIGRYFLRRYVHHKRKSGKAMHKVLVVGTRDSIRDLAVHFNRTPQAGYAVSAACLPGSGEAAVEVGDQSIPVLGEPNQVAGLLNRTDVDVVAIADTTVLSEGELRSLAWSLTDNDIELVVAPAIVDLAGPRISVNPVAGLPLLQVDEPRFNRGSRLLKSGFETIIAAILLLILSPVLLVIAVLIKVTSPGPVLFRQERVGLNGGTFTMIKFRTMVPDAEERLKEILDQNEHDGVLFKIQDDPRITGVGKWLRRLSLDELPQLAHVVVGTMALVGPRPPLPSEVAQYDDVVSRRLLVRPGLTGLWQVSGRADLPWDEAVRLDVYYVDNWSLALDLAILLKTLTAVARGSGAY